MALGDVGIFNPAESTFMRPGAYEDALRADALKRASYLSMMDQFYEQLDETKREFDATAAFKTAALAQDKWIAEQQIGLSREELALKGELGRADIGLRERALTEATAYNTETLKIKRMEINAQRPMNYLGGGGETEVERAIASQIRNQSGSLGPRFITGEEGTTPGSTPSSGQVSLPSQAWTGPGFGNPGPVSQDYIGNIGSESSQQYDWYS